MKKLLLFLSLLQSYCQLNAQAYQPFPIEIGAMWRIDGIDPTRGNDSLKNSYQYVITGDTLIGSYVYHNFYESGASFHPFQYLEVCNPCGSLREENKKVYYYVNGQEELLYDFTLGIGDTLNTYNSPKILNIPQNICIVQAIDSILLANKYHKRYNIGGNKCDGAFIIEGIGSNYGFVEGLGKSSYGYTNTCEKIGKEPPLGINEYNLLPLKLYPNPITKYSILDLSFVQGIYTRIEIYNSLGQILKTAFLKNLKEFLISKDEFPSGYYLYKLSNSSDFVTGKFIVQ